MLQVIRERKMEHKLRKAQEMKKGELTKIEDDNFISSGFGVTNFVCFL